MMKRTMTTLAILIILFLPVKAPEYRTILIPKTEGINHYERLIKAIVWHESKNGTYVWNAKEEAVGWFQIRQCRVDAYNQATGSNYKLTDFYDYELSRKMFLYYCKGKSYEVAAKNWNGSGPLTINYWNQIKSLL